MFSSSTNRHGQMEEPVQREPFQMPPTKYEPQPHCVTWELAARSAGSWPPGGAASHIVRSLASGAQVHCSQPEQGYYPAELMCPFSPAPVPVPSPQRNQLQWPVRGRIQADPVHR